MQPVPPKEPFNLVMKRQIQIVSLLHVVRSNETRTKVEFAATANMAAIPLISDLKSKLQADRTRPLAKTLTNVNSQSTPPFRASQVENGSSAKAANRRERDCL